MAIRDASGTRPAAPGPASGTAGGVAPTLERGLGEAGLLGGGAAPKDAAQSLLGNLARAGFNAPPGLKGDVTAQLPDLVASPALILYRVTGVSCYGKEGP